ncbi:olfactory receptor 56A4-like [Ambystoma mexicanum]|uniref:olfactory receptor 56A4-like n=1 Tax=Ambystoma mexicanum TaxID=8296 RepID=UPI0037E99427
MTFNGKHLLMSSFFFRFFHKTLTMLVLNTTAPRQILHFVLICFPSIQSWQHWLAFPLALLFLVAVVANITILAVIQREQRLHEPMYYFLAILGVSDLVLCTATTPTILGILCFNLKAITLPGCFFQMYIINCFLGIESSTFLFMAYDRYTAICNPLRYTSVITGRFVTKALVFTVLRNTLLSLPMPILAARLDYCSTNVVEHCLCSNPPVTVLACGDRTINTYYQLGIAWSVLGSDLLLIGLSYSMVLRAVWKRRSKGVATKALSTCTSHLILISFFYTILLFLIFINKFQKIIPTDVIIMINVLHYLVPPALNPIVYGVRTKEIRQGMVKGII